MIVKKSAKFFRGYFLARPCLVKFINRINLKRRAISDESIQFVLKATSELQKPLWESGIQEEIQL